MNSRPIAATQTSVESNMRVNPRPEKPLDGPSTLSTEMAYHHSLLDTLHNEIGNLGQMLSAILYEGPGTRDVPQPNSTENAPYVKELVDMNYTLNNAIYRIRLLQESLRL